VDSVTVSPTTAVEASTLTCSATSSDTDGDSVSYTYAWTVGGSTVGTASTLTGAFFDKGDAVTCTVTGSDGTDTDTLSSSAVTIGNTAPVMNSVTLSPSTAYEASTLTCTPSATDADGDTLTYSYAWTVAGNSTGTSGSTLSGTYFDRGEAVTCTATASDGTDTDSLASSSVTISNSTPTAPSVTVTPTSPSDTDTLTCSASGSTDADGDSIAYSYAWTVSGSTIGTASTISSGFSAGDTVTCSVSASDGTDSSSAGTDSVSVTSSSSCTASTCPADLSVGDLLITEFMANPSAVTDANGEWFEVYNNSGVTVGIGELILADNAGSHTVNSAATIAADDYAVFCRNSASTTNGGVTCDYEYGSDLALSNSGDVITLEYGGVTFDEVDFSAWSGGTTSGASMALAFGEQIFDDSDNDTEDYWCDSTTAMSGGDDGTPGTGNDDQCGTTAYHGHYYTGTSPSYGCCVPGVLFAHDFSVTTSGVFFEFHAYSVYPGYSNITFGLYDDDGGTPGNLVAEVLSVAEGNGETSFFSTWTVEPDDGPIWLDAGTYWIAYAGDYPVTSAHFLGVNNGTVGASAYKAYTQGAALPDPFSALGTYTTDEVDIALGIVEF
jgi:hypothetical protein